MSTSGAASMTFPPIKSRAHVRLDRESLGLGRLSIQTPQGSVEVVLGEAALRVLEESIGLCLTDKAVAYA